MKTFFLSFLGGLAALAVFFILAPIALVMTFLPSGEPPKVRNAVIAIDLRNAYPDQPASDSVSALFSRTSFVEVLLRLNAAVDDPNVKGVFLRASEYDLGSSRSEELREAFLRLKAKRKFVIAHSQGFLASGPSSYRAVSAADELWIQPGSTFEVPGIAFETLFLGRILQKFKVTPDIEQYYEYKNAADTYKQHAYTPAHAEAMTALAESVWSTSIADIAADRKADPAAMRTLLEASPYTSEKAVDLKLVDKLGWPEEAEDAAKARAGDAEIVDISDYHPARRTGKAVIAVVGGEGEIVSGGGSGGDILSLGMPMFASDRVAQELLAIADDKSVNAVVFRVDSPGGSATASDQVWRAVERLQEAGKKVVISMGSVAASGGYYVAAGADAIVANESTITGSIGVFGGKFAIADGLREFGIDADSVSVGGPFASAYSSEKFTDQQRADLRVGLDATYARFTGLVAEGRKLPLQKVQEIAKGRVWSGADAQKIGLVDQTGDLIVAIDKAKELAGFKPDDRAEVRLRLIEASPLDLIMQGFGGAAVRMSSGERGVIGALVSVLGKRRALQVLQQLRTISRESGVQLWMPPVMER